MNILLGTLNALLFFILPWVIFIALGMHNYEGTGMSAYDALGYYLDE